MNLDKRGKSKDKKAISKEIAFLSFVYREKYGNTTNIIPETTINNLNVLNMFFIGINIVCFIQARKYKKSKKGV